MVNAKRVVITPVQRAKEALQKAQADEAVNRRKQEQRKADKRKRTAEKALAEYVRAENDKLIRMVGLVVESVTYDTKDEGAITFKFTDGTKFSLSASGDDATHISFGYEV